MPGTIDADSIEALSRELRRWLDEVRTAAADEIRGYPTPIPRCDAQFNHLIEQRAAASRLLGALDAALDGGHPAGTREVIAQFDALPAWGGSVEERRLRDRVAAALGRG